MKILKISATLISILLFTRVSAQNEYSPIGVFGVFSGEPMLSSFPNSEWNNWQSQFWVNEESCLIHLGGNFMIGCTRGKNGIKGAESKLIEIGDRRGLKLCAEGDPNYSSRAGTYDYDMTTLTWLLYYFHVVEDPYHRKGYHHHFDDSIINGYTWKQRIDSCLTHMRDTFALHNGFYGYFVAHETQGMYCDTCYPAIEYICNWIKNNDPTHKSWVCGSMYPANIKPSFFDSVKSLDVIRFGDYPFVDSISPSPDSGVQKVLTNQVSYYDIAANRIKNANKNRTKPLEWHIYFQDCKQYWTDKLIRRRPTANEIRAEAFIALSRGAKGLIFYTYLSDILPAQPNPNDSDYQHEGLVDYWRDPYAKPKYTNDTTYSSVKWINQDLQVLCPVFRTLAWDSATTVHPASSFDSLRYITVFEDGGTGGSTPFDSLYFELATYVDVADTDYFLIVNRQTLPTDTVWVSITIGGKYQGKKIWVVDQLTKEIIYEAVA